MADLVPESEQQYGSILTVLGESAEQNGKMLKKPVEFTHIAFGDANDTYVQPDRKSQSLVNELYRIPVNSVDVLQATPDSVPILTVEALLPDDIHNIVIREFAAVATFNGQEYFHAIGNCARIYVPSPVNNGQLNNPVSLEMTFVITSAEPIVEINPNVITASRDYVDDSSLKVNELVTNEKVYPKNPKRHAKIGDSIPVDTTSVIIKKDNVLSQLVLEKPVFEAGTLETIGNGYLVINGTKYVALPVNNFDVEADIDLDDSIKITRTGRFHGLFLKLFGQDKSAVLVGGEQKKATSGFVVSGFKLKGDDTQPTNDHAVMTVSSVDGAILTEHEVEGGYNSFSLEYGEANIDGDRRSINSVVASFIARGSYMGFEMFSNAYCAVAGLVASRAGRTRGTQHGMRITGYGKNHLNQGHDLRNRGNNYSGFASHNYTNGVSQQTGAFNNNVNFTATDGENGLHFTENTTLDDAISRSNNYTFAIGGMKHGSYLYDPLCSSFRGTIDEGATYGWYTRKGARRAESNSYDLTVSNSNGLVFADSHSRIYVTAKELISGCIISGNWNIVDIVIDENNFNQESQNSALRISGSNNIVRVIVTNAKQPFSEVLVSGHDNDLTLSLDTSGTNGKVALLGNNNTLRGKCNIGTVTGYGNDYSAVSGFYCQGKASVSFTNGRGFINVLMKTGAYALSIEPYLLNEPRILYFKVVSSSASQIVIDAYDKDGNAISGDFSIYYQGRAYQ
ncbi:TPA: hypothetical protein I7123_13875 [Vibrio vulnificus]|nr:hypothetical protein [Vibrio vulnificus]